MSIPLECSIARVGGRLSRFIAFRRPASSSPFLALALLAAVTSACGPCKNSGTRILEESADWDSYGAPLGTLPRAGGTSFSILSEYEGAGSDVGAVLARDGTIVDYCRKDGCWILVNDGGASIRVTCADDKFTLPLNCLGRHVMVEGTFSMNTVSEEEARRYFVESKEVAGTFGDEAELEAAAKSIVGHRHEPTIAATGVRVSKTRWNH